MPGAATDDPRGRCPRVDCWRSASAGDARGRDTEADAAGSFKSGQTLLDRVQVTLGSGRFDVPFLGGIP